MASFVNVENFYKNRNIDQSTPLGAATGHFDVLKLEDLHIPQPHPYNRRDYYKISLVTGHSFIHYARQTFEIRESALVFTNPMLPYQWERKSDEQRGYVCVFTEAFFNQFLPIKQYPVFQQPAYAVLPLASDEADRFESLFLQLKAELQSDYAYKDDFVRTQVLNLIHLAQKMQPAGNPTGVATNATERLATLFTDLLDRQFPIESSEQRLSLHTAAAFAEPLGVHINYLNRAVKEVTSKTTSQWIAEKIILEARHLLTHTSWTITDIAWSLGFEEANHFSAFFKKHTQHTPNQFRKLAPV
ncbi:helix-turn-helix domain-containing protein [Siphonobacter sp.]|uniref:helix-turn-helix domain-containing protein n=1 Tax=Siphonobacter sp. TaxID=1869184 RepID=UPI003B3BE7B5